MGDGGSAEEGTKPELRFRELPFTVETGQAEMIAVDFVAKGGGAALAIEEERERQGDSAKEKAAEAGDEKAQKKADDDDDALMPEEEECKTAQCTRSAGLG